MKILNLLVIVLLFFGLSGCKKDSGSDSGSNIETTPSAVAALNSSSAGVYKGVLVGSSGYFKISIKNGTDSIYCNFKFDGTSAKLTNTSLANWTPGTAITNAVFSGIWNGESVSLTFSCSANGTNPTLTVTVPGHTVNVSIYKETSTTLVKCYEGTYVVAKQPINLNGIWNFIAIGNIIIGYHSDPESNGVITGTISGNTLTLHEAEATLTINDTNVSGSFIDGSGHATTITGKRTL
jgi:hypothetical protein